VQLPFGVVHAFALIRRESHPGNVGGNGRRHGYANVNGLSWLQIQVARVHVLRTRAFAWWKQIRTARLATGGEELDIPAEVICERLISGVLDLEQHAGGGLLGGRRPT
jgi:hypothetical protein